MTVSIIIPYKNGWEFTHSLLYDLYRTDRNNIDEVMLIDDASDDGSISGANWWKKLLPVRIHRFEENVGFLLAANKGLRKAKGDIKILISNDVGIKQPFIQQVITLLEENPKRLIGNYFHAGDTGWNKFYTHIFPYLAGYLLGATADTWEHLEYFDERYAPCDYEDVDLSTKALMGGVQVTSLSLPGIIHIGGQTIKYGVEREKQTKINQKKFEEKWIH